MASSQRTLQEHVTTLPPQDVLAQAKKFFSQRNPLYASFIEKDEPGYCTFRGQGGEEVVVAAVARDGNTLVTASSYLFDMQISRFFTTLPTPEAR